MVSYICFRRTISATLASSLTVKPASALLIIDEKDVLYYHKTFWILALLNGGRSLRYLMSFAALSHA